MLNWRKSGPSCALTFPRTWPSRYSESRAGGRIKRFSDLDLDLVLAGPAPLPLSLLGMLAEAFDESLLPFKVDLVDRRAVGESFGAIVDATKRPLPL